MRTHFQIVAVLGLAAFWTCAAGQGVTQTGETVNFTFTGLAMRVPVSLPLSGATGTVLPSFFCFGPAEAAPSGASRIQGDGSLNDLKAALLNKVYGKSIAELNNLIAAVANASGRDAQLLALFNVGRFNGTTPFVLRYQLSAAQTQQLQMGQEVSGPEQITSGLSSASGLVPSALRCFTTAQIDQAIDVGVGLVATIIDRLVALAKPPAQAPR